jgi:hypothetical protein
MIRRRRPLLRAAAVGTVAGATAGAVQNRSMRKQAAADQEAEMQQQILDQQAQLAQQQQLLAQQQQLMNQQLAQQQAQQQLPKP